MSDRRRREAGRRWIGLLAAVLLMTGGGLVTMTVRAVPAHAWDVESCDPGFDCVGDPGGGSEGLDNGDCLWDSCGDGSESGDPDSGDICTDSDCPDGQNPPAKQCEITIKDDGTIVCTVTAGPDNPPPSDCPDGENCEDPITEQPIDPATCAPADDGTQFLFNQDNFATGSLTTDPFPDMDPLYNDLCPPPPVPPPAATQFGATDVAFGDSYISGEGAGDFEPSPSGSGTSCDVSVNAWPAVVYDEDSVTNALFATSSSRPFENWACSGATVAQIANQISAAQQAGQNDFNSSGAQWAGLGQDTARVEISAGGNDLGFSSVLKCAWHNPFNLLPDNVHSTNSAGARCVPTPARLAPSINALLPRLTSLYESVTPAPGASGPTVDVVGYPMFFPVGRRPACGSEQTGITRVDQIDINNDVLELDDGIRRAAAAAGVNYIDFSTALQGATVCDNPPGVNTFGDALNNFNPRGAGHPNALGHQLLADAYMRANFFPDAGASAAAPADGTLVGDRIGDRVYVAAGGTLFPFAKQPELSSSVYQNTSITLEPSAQVATQLETPPAAGTLLKDAATGVIFAVSNESPEGTALVPLQPTPFVLPAITVPDEALTGYLIADGNFVKVAGGDGTVYQIVGGAPVAVTDFGHVGGPQPVGVVSQAQLNNLPQYPAAGTFVKTSNGTVYEFAGGAPIVVTDPTHVTGYPTGTIPEIDQTAIDDAGSGGAFDHIRQYPADGTFVTATFINTTITNTYEFVGGAPVHVSDWSHVGGQPDGPIASIDQTALDNAGTGGAFSHVRPFPADGTYATGMGDGDTPVAGYVFAGGAPIAISDWTHLGGPDPGTPPAGVNLINVDETALDNAGTGGVNAHVRLTPADGTYVTGMGSGGAAVSSYVFAGGAPIPITDWTHLGGPAPSTPPSGTSIVKVDETALDSAGTDGIFSHVSQYPANGTLMLGNGTNVFVVAGGAPTFVDDFEDIGGARAATTVDQTAIDQAGSGGIFSHLRFRPADGTVIESFGTGHVFVIASGAPLRVTSLANIDPSTVGLGPAPSSPVFVDQDALTKAGSGGFWNHLNFKPADNTLLALLSANSTDLTYFVVAGGAPIYVSDVEDIGGARGSVFVDPAAINSAGSGGDFNHLSFQPANGTIIESFDTGHVYQVTGGVPVLDCSAAQTFLYVDQQALTKAGTGGFYNHLNPLPSPPPAPCPAPSPEPGPQL